MDKAQLAKLAVMMAQIAIAKRDKKRAKRGERWEAAPSGPTEARLSVLRCATCKAPIWAAEASRNAQDEPTCPEHAQAPTFGLNDARTLCSKCRDTVASGVWAYGGIAFGHPWTRHAALCAACGFNAVNWTTLARPEVPKRLRGSMSALHLRSWYRRNGEPRAVRYVLWCRLEQGGQEAAASFAAHVESVVGKASKPKPTPKSKVLFDMSDPEAAWRFLHAHKIAKR